MDSTSFSKALYFGGALVDEHISGKNNVSKKEYNAEQLPSSWVVLYAQTFRIKTISHDMKPARKRVVYLYAAWFSE